MEPYWSDATRTPEGDYTHAYNKQLGRDSVSDIGQAAFFAATGVIAQALRASGADPAERRFITGGDGSALLPHLDGPWQHRPHLVLEGLLALARDQA